MACQLGAARQQVLQQGLAGQGRPVVGGIGRFGTGDLDALLARLGLLFFLVLFPGFLLGSCGFLLRSASGAGASCAVTGASAGACSGSSAGTASSFIVSSGQPACTSGAAAAHSSAAPGSLFRDDAPACTAGASAASERAAAWRAGTEAGEVAPSLRGAAAVVELCPWRCCRLRLVLLPVLPAGVFGSHDESSLGSDIVPC